MKSEAISGSLNEIVDDSTENIELFESGVDSDSILDVSKKRILIAPDKFKGSLSAFEICEILKSEINSAKPEVEIELCPLADGGDGSLEILATYLPLEKCLCNTVDPLGRPIQAAYYKSENTAYIELAAASGIVLLKEEERNPMLTSTYGTGLQIQNAIKQGLKNIILFLGGSATNDGGLGIANALGYKFYDKNKVEQKPIGASLDKVYQIIAPDSLPDLESLTLCCDVENPPFGLNGAAHIYARQKGASKEDVKVLDDGLKNICQILLRKTNIDVSSISGAGAAGGVAISLLSLFEARIESGLDMISNVSNLDFKINHADIVISGEGKLDSQTLEGKVVNGVAAACRKYDKPLWLVAGANELSELEIESMNIQKIFAIIERAKSIDDAMKLSETYLRSIGREIANSI